MARKTALITIDAPGRDQGKAYRLEELPASQAERWATRLLFAMARSGVEVPEDIAEAGLAGVAVLGIRALGQLKDEDVQPLLTEMMSCVQRVPNASASNVFRPLVEDDIEEIATRLRLRMEVFQLHVGFTISGGLSNLAQPQSDKVENPSRNTRTRRKSSAR